MLQWPYFTRPLSPAVALFSAPAANHSTILELDNDSYRANAAKNRRNQEMSVKRNK
jgi:hypothetical protein